MESPITWNSRFSRTETTSDHHRHTLHMHARRQALVHTKKCKNLKFHKYAKCMLLSIFVWKKIVPKRISIDVPCVEAWHCRHDHAFPFPHHLFFFLRRLALQWCDWSLSRGFLWDPLQWLCTSSEHVNIFCNVHNLIADNSLYCQSR